MRSILRTLTFGLLAGTGLSAAAQGHTIFVAGHANPCSPAIAGSTVNIFVYGNSGSGVSATATMNENCYYYLELLVPDTTGWVSVQGPCGNGTSAVDTVAYSLTPPFTTDVIVDLNCGSAGGACSACINMTSNSPFTATFSSCTTGGTGPYTYLWDFSGPGGGGVPGDNISHTFQGAGTYAACLNVIDANGMVACSTCETVYVDSQGNVSLNPPAGCQACFTITQASGGGMLTPFVAEFTNCSTGPGPLDLSWWLPDGTTSIQANETFTFNGPGVYAVCLTINDGAACNNSLCDTVVVDPNGGINTIPVWYDCTGVLWGTSTVGTPCDDGDPATENDIWNGNCYCVGTPVTSTCSACMTVNQAIDGNGPVPFMVSLDNCSTGEFPMTQQWTLNGISLSTAAGFTHLFNGVGPHAICLTTTCADGTTSTTCDTLVFNSDGMLNGTNPFDPCEAGFWVLQAYQNGDTIGGEPIPNTLWIWNLSNGGTGLFQFLWNFGDGTSSTEPFPTHVYAGTGPYLLCLTIWDNEGCTDTYCDTVSVDENGIYNGMIVGGGNMKSVLTINVIQELGTSVAELPALSELELWPNPVASELNITLGSDRHATVPVMVIDASGRTVLTMQQTLVNGTNRFHLDTAPLDAGLYLLRIGDQDAMTVRRFVKAE